MIQTFSASKTVDFISFFQSDEDNLADQHTKLQSTLRTLMDCVYFWGKTFHPDQKIFLKILKMNSSIIVFGH